MKKWQTVVVIILSVILLMGMAFSILVAVKAQYSKGSDVAFSVLQISDIHIVNDEKKDENAFKSIRLLIEKSVPDMIIVTGDITSESDNLTAIKTFCNFMENEVKLPWAFTYGNHDAEGDVKKTEISDYLETLNYCIFEKGDKNVDGEGNYYYNVVDANGKVIQSLIMMDSNMYKPEGAGGDGSYDKFHDNQIDWYKKTVQKIATDVNGEGGAMVPSLAFFHIPMREFTEAYNSKEGDRQSGMRLEKECSGYEDDLMFETMLELGSTKGVFVGHDHMNNYTVDYKGIRLSYAMSSDHNIYLVPHRGGTIINIKNDGTFTTQVIFKPRLAWYTIVGSAH